MGKNFLLHFKFFTGHQIILLKVAPNIAHIFLNIFHRTVGQCFVDLLANFFKEFLRQHGWPFLTG